MREEKGVCERVDPSALCPAARNSISNMRSVSEMMGASQEAPPFHSAAMQALIAGGRIREDPSTSTVTRKSTSQIIDAPVRASRVKFTRGMRVTANSGAGRGKKLTIINANVGYTSKSRTPVHKVSDTQGNVWNEVESKLVPR